MKIIFGVISLWCFGQVCCQSDGPLILTPLLDAGEYIRAQEQSRVNFTTFGNVESYAAYFQVVPENNSNTFFWFFPSRNNSATDPVILILQGGPGISSLFTLFMESGPFVISEDGNITNRIHSWTNFSSVLYIDNPVTAGFSFTDPGTAPTDLRTIGYHLIIAVVQFFKLFPNLRSNDFYIWGESYGGKYVPALGYTINEYNKRYDDDINLKGVCIGNGLTDPQYQTGYGEYFYQIGLIDDHTKAQIEALEVLKAQQIDNEDYAAAYLTFMRILYGIFPRSTGFNDHYNYLHANSTTAAQEKALDKYLNRTDVKAALHVGNVSYVTFNPIPLTDFVKPIPQLVQYLLNNSYSVLVYNGQLDIIIPHITVVNYLRRLNFPGIDEYRNATKHIWKVDNDVAGYVRTGGNLTEVLVRNAGHNAPRDQPAWVYDLLQRFISNRTIGDRTTNFNEFWSNFRL